MLKEMHKEMKRNERRAKARFPIHRELRYKLLEDDRIVAAGSGETVNLSSGGVGLEVDQPLAIGAFIEMSISWPVLLDQNCLMRLIAFGRVVRCDGRRVACTIDKYEFRTQARTLQFATPIRSDGMLQRWAGNLRKEAVKTRAISVSA